MVFYLWIMLKITCLMKKQGERHQTPTIAQSLLWRAEEGARAEDQGATVGAKADPNQGSKELVTIVVKKGNSSYSKILGIGDISLRTNLGCQLILKNVRHVADLRLNLLSGITLDRQGFESHFANGMWKLSKGSLIVAKGKACCSLYKT